MSLSPAKSKYFLDNINEKEFFYLQDLATQGQAMAQFVLACYYVQGIFVEKSLEKASKYFQMAAKQGFREAWQFLGDIYKTTGAEELAHESYKNAFDYHKELADQGFAEEQVIAGMFLEKGIGVSINPQRGFEYYKEAAKQKNPRGLYCIGNCYENGIGVEKSIENAVHYYKLSAAQKYLLAEYSLALCLLKHTNNNGEAVDSLKELIQENSALNSAIKADCYYYLGRCFEEGRGVTASNSEALHYYKLASNMGNGLASSRLGAAYLEEELGLKHSDKKAFHYHQLAIDQGDLTSAFVVAHFYEFGLGTAQSLESALHYYEIAQKNGDPEGHTRAESCRKKMSHEARSH